MYLLTIYISSLEKHLFWTFVHSKIGFLVFFGIEVTLTINLELHLLIYGVSEEFLLTYSDIYDYPLEKIYKLVKEAGGILIQAHPMRREKNLLLPLEYLDGIEDIEDPWYTDNFELIFNLIEVAIENILNKKFEIGE